PAARMRDLAAERGCLQAARENRHSPLVLWTGAQDVVVREDMDRAACRVVADADLVDEASGAAERGLEVTPPARAAVEDRPHGGQRLDFREVDLPVGEELEVRRVPLGDLVDDGKQRRPEPGKIRDVGGE